MATTTTEPASRASDGFVHKQPRYRRWSELIRQVPNGSHIMTPEAFHSVMTPNRVKILAAVHNGEEWPTARALADHLGMAPSNLSTDLKALTSRKLIQVTKHGRSTSVRRGDAILVLDY